MKISIRNGKRQDLGKVLELWSKAFRKQNGGKSWRDARALFLKSPTDFRAFFIDSS